MMILRKIDFDKIWYSVMFAATLYLSIFVWSSDLCPGWRAERNVREGQDSPRQADHETIFPKKIKIRGITNIFPRSSIFSHAHQYFPTPTIIFPNLTIFFLTKLFRSSASLYNKGSVNYNEMFSFFCTKNFNQTTILLMLSKWPCLNQGWGHPSLRHIRIVAAISSIKEPKIA